MKIGWLSCARAIGTDEFIAIAAMFMVIVDFYDAH
jgi:hypothetical protein